MNMVKVFWHRQFAQWQVAEFDQQAGFSAPISFSKWGASLADLTPVIMILAAENYTCQWLSLPGVNARHLNKALPFALEENLIEDVDLFHIVAAEKANKHQHKVYAVKRELLENLIESCELHHVRLEKLIPETALIPDNCLVYSERHNDVGGQKSGQWLFKLAAQSEGVVLDAMLPTVFDHEFSELEKSIELSIFNTELDSPKLIKTQLESSYTEAFSQIQLQLKSQTDLINQELNDKNINLLQGELKVAEPKKDKVDVWWQVLPVLASVWLLSFAIMFILDSSQLENKQKEVRNETVKLYKQLFPGERVQSLKRQIDEKLNNGKGAAVNSGFIPLLHSSVSALQDGKLKAAVNWQSFRYNSRQAQLQVELTASDLALLQAYKAALEGQGMVVEISSAVNEGQLVKGRLKISGS